MTPEEVEFIVFGIGGLGEFGVFNVGAMAWREDRTGQRFVADASSPGISFTLIRSVPREMLQLSRSGAAVVLDLHLPTHPPVIFLSRCLHLSYHDLPRLRLASS